MKMAIPEYCKAGVVVNEGPNFSMAVQQVKVPSPAPDEILIRLNASGVCYSDVHYMLNDTPAKRMSESGVASAGHEGSGIVVKVGEKVTNFRLGDRAGVKPIWNTCGCCVLCWDDKESHCQSKVLTGLGVTGTFQHYVLAPARYATPIPDGIPDDIAAVMMCSGATAYRSVKSSGLTPGSWVAILGGGGGVGVQVIQIARIFGLRPIVVDSGDSKCEISMRMGAEAFVDFGKFEDPAAEVVRISDGGANGVFVTAPAAYSMALRCIGSSIGSIIMCIGMSAMMSGHSIEASPNLLILKNITIKGTLAGTMDDTGAVLKFAQRGLIKQASRIISLEELPKTIEELKKGEVVGKLVVDFNR